jgi:hypothetical protein
MKDRRWLMSHKGKMIMLGGLSLLTLTGLGIGLIGCGGGSGSDSPTGPNSQQCEELDEQCWACEDNVVRTDPACAAATSCLGVDDFWACLPTILGEGSDCEVAINRACYTLGSACDQAWDACTTEGSCEKAEYRTWRCELQVLSQIPSCAGADFCMWADDLYGCVEDTLGEDSECEHQLSLGCYQKGTAGDTWWQSCHTEHYTCSQTSMNTCLTWLLTQPACTAEDRQCVQACLTTMDLYSEACWQQDTGVSNACWETLESRADCQLDACDSVW